MADTGHAVIQTFLREHLGEGWETDWDSLAELADRPEAKSKLSQLQKLFPDQDIMPWSRDELAFNLLRGPWDQLSGDQLRPSTAQKLLRLSLSLGVSEAIKLAQRAADVDPVDGIMGPQTVKRLNQIEVINDLIDNLQGATQNVSSEQATPQPDNTQQAEPIFKQGTFVNPLNLEPDSTQQAQSNTSPTDTEFSTMYAGFNPDAIDKKSTSDVWTIKDQLGYEGYAQAFAKLILDGKAEPPLTVSIQAPWGQGKTSLMRMIKHKLEHGIANIATDRNEEKQISLLDRLNIRLNNIKRKLTAKKYNVPGVQTKLSNLTKWIKDEPSAPKAMLPDKPGTLPCVWFNPLYFQNSNQVWSGLAHEILHQLARQLPNQFERERFWFRLQMARLDTHAIRRDIHKLIFERLLPKALLWLLVLMLMVLPQIFTGLPLAGLFKSAPWLNAFPFLGFSLQSLTGYLKKNKDWVLTDKLVKYIQEPNYSHDMGLLHLVDQDLDRALDLLLGENGRAVVFIDDLDRCAPETVNNIMLAINQFISVQDRNLYFFLGMDTYMVAMAIESAAVKQADTYNIGQHSSKGYGWRFMEKFVQLPFLIPRLQPAQVHHYMRTLLQEQAAQAVNKEAIDNLKDQIKESANLGQIQDIVSRFKHEHQVDSVPEVDASVAAKIIDITSDKGDETINKLITLALTDLALNPREIKIFLNVARMYLARLAPEDNTSSDEYLHKVVRASHLIIKWPQCLRWLLDNASRYTRKGNKTDPVEYLDGLFNNPGIDTFEKWKSDIEDTWGKNVAETIAQPDFYSFCSRIHDDPPTLQDISRAGIF